MDIATAEYRENRERVILRDRGLCLHCGVVHGRYTAFADVDHWLRQACGGTDDETNLSRLCREHHDAKTRWETKDRVGFPPVIDLDTGYRIKLPNFARVIRDRTSAYHQSLVS